MYSNSSLLRLNTNMYFEDNMLFSVDKHIVERVLPLHWHEFYEIEYILSGNAIHTINGRSFKAQKGSISLITPVDFHTYEYEGDEDITVINVKFHDTFLPARLRSDIYRQSRPMQACVESDYFRDRMLKLLSEYESNRYGREIIIQSEIVELCIEILRGLDSAGELVNSDSVYSPLQEAILYVRTNFRLPITADEVAKYVHLSPSYFSEYFKKQTGEKFSIYVLKLRLDFSANLLKISKMGVKEISREAGFNSDSYFSNIFKEYYGVSPAQYRKMYGQTEE